MSEDLLFEGGSVYLPEGLTRADVFVKDGSIAKIGPHLSGELDTSSIRTFDISQKILLPGIIDSQVHFREPGLTHKEDLATGSQAAALGGITTFLEMPNTSPSTTSWDALQRKIELASKKSVTHFGFFIGATGTNLEELKKSQARPGCCGIKIFLGSSTGDLLLYNPQKIKEIFENTYVTISCHSENEELLRERKNIRDRATSAHAHPLWRDVQTAFSSTQMLIGLAQECQRKVHVLHLTTREEMEFLAQKKDFCTVEVTPQHLTLQAPDCYDQLGSYAQMNPPIRTKEHRLALWEGVVNGTADIIGSDHAPHTRQEKELGYPQSPSGMPGVQTLLPLMLDHINGGRLSLDRLVEMVCTNPARIFCLSKKGAIQVGHDADLTLIDMNLEHRLSDGEQASRTGWTPFHGKKVKGMPIMTVVGGVVVMKDGHLTGLKAGRPITTTYR